MPDPMTLMFTISCLVAFLLGIVAGAFIVALLDRRQPSEQPLLKEDLAPLKEAVRKLALDVGRR